MADSKITDLAALTGANLATGDVLEVTDISDTSMDPSGTSKKITADELAIGVQARGRAGRVVSRTVTDVSAVNTTTETVIASQAIPTTVAAGDVLRLVAVGDLLNNTGGTATYLAKAIIGATAVVSTNAGGLSTSATRRQWRLELAFMVNATNDQRAAVTSIVTGTGAGWSLSPSVNGNPSCGYGTAVEDLTAGKNAQFSITIGTANTNADFACHASWLEVTKA